RTEEQAKPEQKGKTLHDARMFFKRREDFETLSAATERIFPEDDNGPGAIELGVPYFIDKQLAGSWGTNAKAYMHDPFRQNQQVKDYQHKDTRQDKSGANTSTKAPTPTPRYQTRLNRSEEDQDEILQNFESGEIEMEAISSKTFFNILLQMTIEGAYADPVYGGNKNMMGWQMKEYPGPRMAYINDIDADEFIKMDQK